jgi:nucleoside-triphosphatase
LADAFLLTGRPGVGKTTVIRAVLERMGHCAGGFYTVEVRERGKRTGFQIVGFGLGPERRGTLAGVNVSSRHRVGKYGVHVGDLERVGVAALMSAVNAPEVGVVIVDEIGKMEIVSDTFRRAVLAALDCPKPVLASVLSGRQPWVDAIKGRPGIIMVEVTLSNRQRLPDRIVGWIDTVL